VQPLCWLQTLSDSGSESRICRQTSHSKGEQAGQRKRSAPVATAL
jgi:hypothetical protein